MAIATSLGTASAGDQPAPTVWSPYTPPTVPSAVQAVPPPIRVENVPAVPMPVTPKMADAPKRSTRPLEGMNLPAPPATPVMRSNQPQPMREVTEKRQPGEPQFTPSRVPIPAQPAVMIKQVPAAPQTQVPAQPVVPSTDTNRMMVSSGLPDRNNLFRLDSDKVLNERILKELGKKANDEKFPPMSTLSPPGETYVPKTALYEPRNLLIEPNYVIHRHLYFEEKNSERAAWDAGPAQSMISSLYFYRDVLLFPSKIGSHVHDCYDSSAGKCAPGQPTPYYYYPPGITTFGGVVGATVITGAAVIFP